MFDITREIRRANRTAVFRDDPARLFTPYTPPPAPPKDPSTDYYRLDPATIKQMEDARLYGGALPPWLARGMSYNDWAPVAYAEALDAKQKQDIAIQLQQAQLGHLGTQNALAGQATAVTRQNELDRLAQSGQQHADNMALENARLISSGEYQKGLIANDQAKTAQTIRADNLRTAGDNANRDVTRGSELLKLGSKPDTMLRYLYALRGKQAPQGFDQPSRDLPGFGPNATNVGDDAVRSLQYPSAPNGADQRLGIGAMGPPPAATTTTAPAPAVGTNQTQGPAATTAPAYANPANAKSRVDEALGPGVSWGIGNLGGGGSSGQLGGQHPLFPGQVENPDYQHFRQSIGDAQVKGEVAPGAMPNAVGPGGTAIYGRGGPEPQDVQGFKPFAKGGIIPEPVLGKGQVSGQTYEFGENGPEGVVPNDQLPPSIGGRGAPSLSQSPAEKLIEILSQLMQGGAAQNKFAGGGTIGFDPSAGQGNTGYNTPNAALFNPSNLSQVANAPELAPGVPNLPSVSYLTGGGASLIPSAQRLNNVTASEKSAYSGFLQDQAGVNPEDVYQQTERTSPTRLSPRSPIGAVALGITGSRYS